MLKNIFLLFCCLLFSCSSGKENNAPENILHVHKMAEVLTDIHLLETSINNGLNNGNINNNEAGMKEILAKHQIKGDQFQESFDYYTTHLDSLNKIYELVLIKLSKMQAQAGQ